MQYPFCCLFLYKGCIPKNVAQNMKNCREITWREIIVDTKILVSLLKAKTIRWCPPLLKWYYLKIRALHEIMKNRNSHQKRYVRKGVLRNFVKFSGKRMCQSLFFNKVTSLRPCNIIKKEILAEVFSCEFCEISKNTFSCRAPPVAA